MRGVGGSAGPRAADNNKQFLLHDDSNKFKITVGYFIPVVFLRSKSAVMTTAWWI